MGLMKGVLVVLIAFIVYKCFWRQNSTSLDSMKESIAGKRVLITGGSYGLGEQLAYKYASMGADVFVTARSEDKLKQVVEKCKVLGVANANHDYIIADMLIPSDAHRIVPESIEKMGGIDILILNHARMTDCVFSWDGSRKSISVLREVMEVNFMSHVILMSDALPHLEANKGSVGVISSVAGFYTEWAGFFITYSTSKHALEGFFRGLRSELLLKGSNVSITMVAMGAFDSDTALVGMKVTCKLLGIDCDTMKENLQMAKQEDVAMEVLRATTLRDFDVWCPSHQRYWWKVLLYHIFPEHVLTVKSLFDKLPF